MAKWMPLRSRPGIGRSRATGRPAAETDRVELVADLVGSDVDSDVEAGLKTTPSASIWSDASVEAPLLHLELGMP